MKNVSLMSVSCQIGRFPCFPIKTKFRIKFIRMIDLVSAVFKRIFTRFFTQIHCHNPSVSHGLKHGYHAQSHISRSNNNYFIIKKLWHHTASHTHKTTYRFNNGIFVFNIFGNMHCLLRFHNYVFFISAASKTCYTISYFKPFHISAHISNISHCFMSEYLSRHCDSPRIPF